MENETRAPVGKSSATCPAFLAPAVTPATSAADAVDMEMKKCVRWSTITVYEFGVGLGGSAVPRRGGPSIGLARKPQCVWSSPLDDVERTDGEDEDMEETKAPAVVDGKAPGGDKKSAKKSAKKPAARVPRRRKVRWLKPLERVTMLTNAGCSEKRIYRMMMESSEIAMSRRLTLSVDRAVTA